MTCLEHRRSTKREGIGVLISVGAMILGLEACLFFFRTLFLRHGYDLSSFLVFFRAIEVVCALFLAWYAVSNIRMGQQFICRIDNDAIECISPVKGCGDTFNIQIRDILKVERQESSESHDWYIRDRAGNRYWLTSNYGNPADRFIVRIRELNESVTEVRT